MKKMFPMIITFVTIFLASISVAGQQPATPAAAPAARKSLKCLRESDNARRNGSRAARP